MNPYPSKLTFQCLQQQHHEEHKAGNSHGSCAEVATAGQPGNPCAATTRSGAHLDLEVMQGCDHFFYEQWDEVATLALGWVRQVLARQSTESL